MSTFYYDALFQILDINQAINEIIKKEEIEIELRELCKVGQNKTSLIFSILFNHDSFNIFYSNKIIDALKIKSTYHKIASLENVKYLIILKSN